MKVENVVEIFELGIIYENETIMNKLVQKLITLPLKEREGCISAVVEVVFEKALNEEGFSNKCAKMVYFVELLIYKKC
jgi:hypothetical protein